MGNQQAKERRHHTRRWDCEHAERPSAPGKPYLVGDNPDHQPDFITIRWSPSTSDGGAPIIGYLVEHRRTGSPHWLRASPQLAADTEFTLTGLEPGWRYQFRVSAENDIGRSEPGELSEPLTVTLQRSAASAPHFNKELHDTVALENEKVEFLVNVIATPPPKISWYKDGFEIFSNRRMKVVTDNEQSTLLIHQAALEDEGEIKCTATNRAGHVVCKANLKLEAPPRIRLPRQYEDGLLFERGEVIRLKVSTAGQPLPQVYWFHNGELLEHGGRYEITDSERSSSVRISEGRRDDRGEYLIKGMNKIGEDVTSFLVTVTDRPLPPGKAQVVMRLGRSVTLAWTRPDDDGGCKIGNYIVEYFRVGWNMWLKAATCRLLTATLSELIEGSEYKFRIKAENPYGLSEPSDESDVIFIPDPKRGLLTAPVRANSAESPIMDTWLDEDKKRSSEDNEEKHLGQEFKKRRLLEENARKLLDTPLSVLLSKENTKPANLIEKPARRSKIPTPSPSPTYETYGTVFAGTDVENMPPPLPPKRKNRTERQSYEDMLVDEQEEGEEGEEDLQVAQLAFSSQRRNSFPPASSLLGDTRANFLNVTGLRENDDSVLHGSSELMLVLLPEERAKSLELSAQHRSEVEMSLAEEGVAPPMSLSAPELGSGEILEMPPMRDAVSSTELLHERAMARFYQAVADEEAQKMLKRRYSGDRKSLERRASFKEANLERRHSMRESATVEHSQIPAKIAGSEQEQEISKHVNREACEEQPRKKIPKELSIESGAEMVRTLEQTPQAPKNTQVRTESKLKPLMIRKEERLNSVEREQLEFAFVRDRIRAKNEENVQKNELPTRPANLKQNSFSSQLSSFEGDEDAEMAEETVDEEEDYLEEEEEEDEEEVDEEEDNDDSMQLNDTEFRPKTIIHQTPPPIPKHGPPVPSVSDKKPKERAAPRAEEETYHPRSMIPTRSVFHKFEAALPPTAETQEETKPTRLPVDFKLEEHKEIKEPDIKIKPTRLPVDLKLEKHKETKMPDINVKPSRLPVDLILEEHKETKIPDINIKLVASEIKPARIIPQVQVQEAESGTTSGKIKEIKIADEVKELSKIPIAKEKPEKVEKKRIPILKKIGKLTKREKKTPDVPSVIVDSTIPVATIALPKPILKKKVLSKKTTKEESNNVVKTNGVEDDEEGKVDVQKAQEDDGSKKKKQVRIAEPSEAGLKVPQGTDPKLSPLTAARNQRLKRRQESLEEEEEANRVLIYHYSDIVREFGGAKKPAPKMYLNIQDLEAHVTPEEAVEDPFDEPQALPPSPEQEETEERAASDTEERGSAVDMAQVETASTASGELEHSDKEMSPAEVPKERSLSPSPEPMRPLSPEERVRSSMEYVTDLAMFVVACWLYLFKSEVYAIPVLCLMVYRQVKDTMVEKYQYIKESIENRIPERFKKKNVDNESEEPTDQ